MNNWISIFLLSFIFIACEEQEKPIVLAEVIEYVEAEPLEEKSQIEAITDYEKVIELKNQIKAEQEAKERARLDSLPLAMRLAEYDSLAYDSINALLISGNTEAIKSFLIGFAQYKPIKYKLKDEAIQNSLLTLLKDTTLERQIMKTIGALGLPYESAFVDRYKNGQEKYKAKYFYWIGRKGKNIEVLTDVIDQIKRKKIPKELQEDIIYGLRQFSNSRDPLIKEKAISAALLAYKAKWITSKDISTLTQKEDRNEMASSFLKMMLKNGDKKAKSIHNVCLKQGVMVYQVFENLVNSKDGRAKSILLKQLTNRKMFLKTLAAVPLVYKMQKDSIIPIKTIQMLAKHKYMSPDVGKKIHYIFSKMGCKHYLMEADRYIKDKNLVKQLQKSANRPKPTPQSYEDIVVDLFALNVTDSIDHSTLKQIKSNEVYQGKNSLIKNILHYNNQLVSIDKWASETPINYDFLLNGFKKQLTGEAKNLVFKSEYANNTYTILIIGSNKAVFVHPEDLKDEIDAHLIVNAINEVLNNEKLLVLNDDPDFLELFHGSEADLNKVKSLMQSESQDLPF